jgi:two-component system, chemotaxis family, protein-glutamate methylesterase/glutaminase
MNPEPDEPSSLPAHEHDESAVRVLIVEDRPVARKLLMDELSQVPDVRVSDVARDGEEAIEIVRSRPVDVVIMDLVMPSKDGIETISEIRGFSDVPIILLTGASIATESLEHVARRKGANAFIRKPSGPVSVDMYRITERLLNEIRRLAQKTHEPHATAKQQE